MYVITFIFAMNSILIGFIFKPEPYKEGIVIELTDQIKMIEYEEAK